MPKKGEGLGQFPDLSRGLGKKEEVVILRGGGVDTPMHTMYRNSHLAGFYTVATLVLNEFMLFQTHLQQTKFLENIFRKILC